MSKAVSLQKRIQQLKKAQTDLSEILYNAAKEATLAAVEAATEATPDRNGRRGTNTETASLKESWSKDSKKEPEAVPGGYVTWLNNDLQYASYVNDGHRMDRHFVPGLHINPDSGLLEYDKDKDVGIVVGTKTQYVKGEFMVDKAKDAYQKTAEAILDEKTKELLK